MCACCCGIQFPRWMIGLLVGWMDETVYRFARIVSLLPFRSSLISIRFLFPCYAADVCETTPPTLIDGIDCKPRVLTSRLLSSCFLSTMLPIVSIYLHTINIIETYLSDGIAYLLYYRNQYPKTSHHTWDYEYSTGWRRSRGID